MKKPFWISKTAFLAIFLVASVCAYSQDKFGRGFYIKTNGDTVIGLIEYQKNYDATFTFKENDRSKSVKLSTSDVTQFSFFLGLRYSRLDFGTDELLAKPIFAKLLLEGSMDLYKYQGAFFIDAGGKNRIMLAKEKAGTDSEALKNYQKNIGFFNIVFNDCKVVQSMSSQTPIKQEPLIQLLAGYHTCKNERYTLSTKWNNKRIINIGFFVGGSVSKIQYHNIKDDQLKFLERSEFKPFSYMTLGALIVPQPRDPTSIVSWQHEFGYQKGEFQGDSYYETNIGGYNIIETSLTTIRYSVLRYNFGPRVTFRSSDLAPYIAMGIGFNITGSFVANSVTTHQINDSPVETKQVETPVSGSPLWMSMGLRKKIGKRHTLFSEAYTTLGLEKSTVGRISNSSFKIGFLF